jgi:hypothetical protein
VHSELGGTAIRILHCDADVKSSQRPIESGTVAVLADVVSSLRGEAVTALYLARLMSVIGVNPDVRCTCRFVSV